MVLADLSPAMLEIARREIAAAGVWDRVDEIAEADARDLARWPSESFDAVVALGPFYHLVTATDRRRAARECRRVLGPGGRLFVTVMPRYGWLVQQLLAHGSAGIPQAEAILRDGVYRDAPGSLADAYLFRPEEVAPFFEAQGFRTEALLASQGFLALVQEQVAELQEQDEAAYAALLDMAAATAADPSIHGTAGHLLYVGKRV